jgi:hypothetical protein
MLDGRGGDTRTVRECAFADLDGHAYHLGPPFSFASPLRPSGAQPRPTPEASTEKRTARLGGAASPERRIRGEEIIVHGSSRAYAGRGYRSGQRMTETLGDSSPPRRSG